MNASAGKKTKWVAGLVLLGGLSACASDAAKRSVPDSALSPRIQALVEANRRYPRWEDFPAAPTDLPATERIASNVAALNAQGGALTQEAARIDWTLGDAEALAAETRAQVEQVPVSPDSARTAEEIEAFAQGLRERAKAPPPIDRRPAQ